MAGSKSDHTQSGHLEQLKRSLAEIQHLEHAAALLDWDQQVNMPAGGAEARSLQLATLEKMAHELFIADSTGDLLAKLNPDDYPPDSAEACLIKVVREDWEKERKIPSELVEEMARTTSRAQEVWSTARQENDFASFQPWLAKILELNRRQAELLGWEDHIYDALLDLYEPHMKSNDVARIFNDLSEGLVPLVREITSRQAEIDSSFLERDFDVNRQWDFGMRTLEAIGFDLKRGRQDKSTHPFTTNFSRNDVRVTTRLYADNMKSALFSTLHEGGHGLYEQNVASELENTPLGTGTSLGIHESQSRLWENLVGRSEPFWRHYYPQLQELFGAELAGVTVEQFYQAINLVEPSLIRVEADEVTYNLHIFLRFDLERELLSGDLAVADLPEAWNAKMKQYLGIRPGSDADGVLQDVHWSAGLMGYFPTYALGNLLSVQFYLQARQALPDLEEQIGRGEFAPLREWLTENIYRHGRKFHPAELVHRVTGGEISAQPFLDYTREKFGRIYSL